MNLVYIVRRGDVNHELRYSLRSVARFVPDARVWVVGYRPRWLHGVEFVQGNRHHSKPLNVFDNVRIACTLEDVGDRFVLMNDDFYLLGPLDLRPLYRCTLDEHIALLAKRRDQWTQSITATKAWLATEGVSAPLSYELHIPLMVDRAKMGDALDRAATHKSAVPPQFRTAYGNLHVTRARRIPADCKVRRATDVDEIMARPLVSSSDATFPRIRPRLEALFPEPSPFER